MANTAIHLSRLQEILTDGLASLRPRDGSVKSLSCNASSPHPRPQPIQRLPLQGLELLRRQPQFPA